MGATFSVINDQSGDEKDVTLKEWEKLQGQGYRILDTAAYDNAVAAAPEAKSSVGKPAEAKPVEASADEEHAAQARGTSGNAPKGGNPR